MECIPWGPFLLFTATQGGLCLPKFSFPSCLGTKTQWPMPCHGVPWHHPLGTSSSTTFWKQLFWLPLPFLLPRWHSYRWLPRTWHAGLQSCSSSSPHRDILTLKMSVKHVRVLTVVWRLLYPRYPLLSSLLTALWHTGHWWPLKPMKYVPTSGTQGVCTHCSHHKECSSPGSLPSFIHDCIREYFLPFAILKVPPLSLFLAALLYYLHSTYYYLILHHLCLKVFPKYLKHNKEHKTIIWKHFLECTTRTLINSSDDKICLENTGLLLSHFSRVRLCATPQTAAHQAPSSLGFSRQEHWSGLPFPSPMHASEKWKWSR